MKNSGVEWIGEIPDEWEISKTKYLTKLYTGNSIKDEEKNLYEDKADAVPYISSKDINVTFSTTNYENGMYVKHSDNSFVRAPAGSTLMCIEGGSAGKKKTFLNQEVCFVNKLCCFSPIKIDNKFLFYCLNSPNYEEEFRFNISGMIGGVSVGKLNQFILPKPPKETQQRIASYLDKKCSKIEETIQNQQQVIEKLKAYKQSLITEAVTGKVKIVNGKVCDKYESYKESGVEWIGKIPSEWNCPKIKYLHKGLTDGTHGTYNRLSNGYLLLSSKNVRDNCIEISDNESFISEEDFKEITANGFPQKDDVLLCCIGASIGRCTIYDLDETVAFQRSVIMIRCNEKIVPKFLMYALKSSYVLEQENVLINQSAQAGLYQGLVSKIYITISSVSEQKEISNYLDKKCTAIDTAIEQKQNLIEKLTEYKKSLIYECVTGKKEI